MLTALDAEAVDDVTARGPVPEAALAARKAALAG